MTPAIADEVVHLHILFSHGFEMAAQKSSQATCCRNAYKCLVIQLDKVKK